MDRMKDDYKDILDFQFDKKIRSHLPQSSPVCTQITGNRKAWTAYGGLRRMCFAA